MPAAVTHFAQKISRYFMDFLRTDFKKSAVPRRKIQLQTEAGCRCGIPLRQYSTLLSAIWKQLAVPMANLKPLRIGPNRYTTPISPVLKNLVKQQIDALDDTIFNAVHDATLARATDLHERATQNPEAFVDEVIVSFADAVSKRVIHPLLSLLNESFQQHSYAAIESIFEVEHALVESLCAATISNLPSALNTFIVTGKLEPVQAVLTEFFVAADARIQLNAFFDGFAAADAYQALRDLWQTMRTGDNLAFYIYLCELRFDKLAFPLFYIPVQLKLDEKTSEYIAAFDALTQAFPVIIASIRDFAEYVPLKHDVFDLVVIDEASQVSIAQAFPALLRAKKVVVLGDQRQFSNVKSSQASLAMNHGYRSELEAYFRTHISDAADRIQRLKQFDVKKSVLEFFELIANYRSMLKKHFRGYQALISLSSKFFYDNALQAIKVRSKPINEILEFSWVTPANTHEPCRNVNSAEGKFIVALLRTMIDEANPHSVAIITPFREQQQYLAKTIFHDPYASQFEQCLRLKIMTFDTCQGEERDLVIYSMVAVPSHDSLNYIFPPTLEDVAERAEEALKVQRLNVGFSRAKEKMHFVLSKPIEHYKGSIGQVLAHYQSILQRDKTDQASATVPANSPLAQKALGWLLATSFYQLNQDEIEIVSPFPVNVYLQQLDPSYQHPARRIALLLRFYGEQKTVNAVLEYDDFEESAAQNGNSNHSSLSPTYYRPQDIEQQFILESYGYTFIRLNRFNLGEDPVQTLSERLFALVDAARQVADAAVVTDIRSGIKELGDGSAKICRRCEQIKNKEAFFDQTLSAGQGGYGHICSVCKAQRKRRRLG